MNQPTHPARRVVVDAAGFLFFVASVAALLVVVTL